MCLSTGEWIKKMRHTHTYLVCVHTYTHTHNGILLSHKKNEILPFATNAEYFYCSIKNPWSSRCSAVVNESD